MTTNANMPTEFPYATQVIQDMPKAYHEIEGIVGSNCYGIPVSCLEARYKDKFKRSLDYNSLGVETIEELLNKMCFVGMVLLNTDGETDEKYVMSARLPTKSSSEIPTESSEIQDMLTTKSSSEIQDMPTTKSSEIQDMLTTKSSSEIQDMPTTKSSEIQDMPRDVYQQIRHILRGYLTGIQVSWIEKLYHSKFKKSLDYGSLGVKNMEELLGMMHDKGRVLLYKEPESKETYVMCAWFAERLLKFVKLDVEELLDKHGGEILLSRFEGMYEDEFKLKLNYHHYGLTGPDHLCQVLNLGLKEAAAGEKVIKARKIYNLRKRKMNG